MSSKTLLVTLSVLLILIHSTSYAMPTGSLGVAPDTTGDIDRPSSPDRQCIRDGLCGRKGRFCELICKNNPSEGGKMCK